MQYFRLTPLDVSWSLWERRVCRGPIIIRAHNENVARSEATRHAAKTGPIASYSRSPWGNSSLTICEPLYRQRPTYPEAGPVAVLSCGCQQFAKLRMDSIRA